LVQLPPEDELSIIVVIPCIGEPDIPETLQSLFECDPSCGKTEVIVLINEPEGTTGDLSRINLESYHEVKKWIGLHPSDWISCHLTGPVVLPAKWAGAGLARKKGMDEALYRFNKLNKPGGIIVSLDADTLVEKNYLQAIENYFRVNPSNAGVTLRFSHQTEGLEEKQQQGILLYEKYLHYYKEAVASTGYPDALHTIGSAFAVTAGAYMRRGGMTRRKAGEDFYFLQTLTQVGKVGELSETCVYPSARVSQRVPFGTGIAMKKWMEGSDDLFYSFNFQAFSDLKILFSIRHLFYRSENDNFSLLKKQLPEPVSAFLEHEHLLTELSELGKNCSSVDVFLNRFFQIFNAFRILKFLNFSHPRFYQKENLDQCLSALSNAVQQSSACQVK